MNNVVHIRLLDGTELFARLVESTKSNVTIEYPMEIIKSQQANAIKLNKFLPYTIFQYYTLPINKLVTITDVSSNFSHYYYNSIYFHNVYIEPQIEANMKEINKAMDNVLSKETQEFLDVANKYNVDLSQINNQTKLH